MSVGGEFDPVRDSARRLAAAWDRKVAVRIFMFEFTVGRLRLDACKGGG
jgi:hypothetical protein